MKIWMLVTTDKFEFPVVMAKSATELARLCGVDRNSILAQVNRVKLGKRKRSRYVCVEIDEDEED